MKAFGSSANLAAGDCGENAFTPLYIHLPFSDVLCYCTTTIIRQKGVWG
jgi:hypothetical protein